MHCFCTLPECYDKHYGRGYCKRHYRRFIKHGDPRGGRPTRAERLSFIRYAARFTNREACLPWPFNKGYGRIHYRGFSLLVHRIVLSLAKGRGQSGQDAAHNCGNPNCVNPKHLRWASRSENLEDRISHRTAVHIGETNHLSKLTRQQVVEIRSRVDRGEIDRTIAKDFGVSKSQVGHIRLGKSRVREFENAKLGN